MFHLTESQCGEIIGLYKDKQSLLKISKLLKIHRTTVSRTIKNYLIRNNLATLPKIGCPKLLISKDKKILKKITRNLQNKLETNLLKKPILKFLPKQSEEICMK